ncbi:MAG: efflux RND transporter periplasmic adaptor subunit [Pyrinomonadaceae bacterium]
MSSKFKVQSSKLVVGGAKGWLVVSKIKAVALLLSLFTIHYSLFTVSAHEGEDHSAEKKTTTAPTNAAQTVSIVTAERNIQGESGNFNFVLRRSPSDPRVGETGQFLVRIAEKVKGGFGANEPVPLDKATVRASIIKTDGTPIAENLPADEEENGNYRVAYTFGSAGDYKIVFAVATADNRNFSGDFPVSVASAPVRSSFWIGLAILSLLTLGLLGAVFFAARNRGEGRVNYKRVAPFAVAALLIFVFGTFALAYFLPPRQTRTVAEIPANATTEIPTNALATGTVLTVPKESQILFGIKTALVSTRQITSGLKTTGVVRSRPDARAVVVPPVAGRIVLRQGLTLGSAVGRGEQIGTVEQILDVSGQAGLESQRLEVEAQQRDVEARKLELRNTALALQGQQAQQRAAASQAKTRLAQAQRELRRSENLVEVGAAPRRRVEEAQTSVRVVEQEVTAADRQVVLLENQIKQAQAGQAIFNAPTVRQPTRSFPLTSPVAGIINEIKATSGQQVETGTEIMSIANLSNVLLEAQVFERDLPLVRESTRASFTAAALNGEVYTIGTADGDGGLLSIGQTVNEQTRTVPVIYEIINPLQRLRDGMFIEITIDTSGDRQVLAVPKNAVVTEQGQTFVFVFDGGEAFEKRPVALGAEGADYFEVASGLKEGERVVTEGIYQLRSTQPGA